MIKKYAYQNLVWVDLLVPTKEEVSEVAETYKIHPLVEKELRNESEGPRVEVYENSVYVVLHFPALKHSHGKEQNQEVDFVIGKDFIITTRYDSVDSLDKFAKSFEASSIVDKDKRPVDAGAIFVQMTLRLYRSVLRELEVIHSNLHHIEEEIFKNNEREMVGKLSKASRALLDLEQGLLFHHETLEALSPIGAKFFGDYFTPLLQKTVKAHEKVKLSLNQSKKYLDELRKTNDSLLSLKQNETMRLLTAAAVVFTVVYIVLAIVWKTWL